MPIAEHATDLFDRPKASKSICITQPPPLRCSNQNSSSDAANTSPAESSPIREQNPSTGQNPKKPLSTGLSRLNLHEIRPHFFTKTLYYNSLTVPV